MLYSNRRIFVLHFIFFCNHSLLFFLHYSSVFVFSNSLFQFSLTNTLIFSVHAFVFIDVHYAGLYVKYCFQYAMLRSSTFASKFQERGTNDLTFLSRKLHLQVDSRYRTARLQPLYVGFVSYPVCIVATHLKITLFICFLYLFFILLFFYVLYKSCPTS